MGCPTFWIFKSSSLSTSLVVWTSERKKKYFHMLLFIILYFQVFWSLFCCFPDKFCTACQMANIEYGNVVLIFFRPRYCLENAKNCISGHLNFKHFWVSMTQTPYAKTRAMFYGNKLKCKARTFLGFLFLHFCVN